jgi:hypothetical protein
MENKELNGYDLSRNWFDFCFENPELIKPLHTAIYFFAIEHCNRLGWKRKFGFPSQMTMDAIGVKKYQTYIKCFNDIIDWGFFELVQKSKNQYSANIICLISALPKNGKALDKAIIKHGVKQGQSTGQSTGQSKDSINKQVTNKPINQQTNKQVTETSSVYNSIKQIFLKEFKKVSGTEYYFAAKDGSKIKSIIKQIEHAYRASGNTTPTAPEIINGFTHIITRAHNDEWISKNFNLSIIDSQFNNLKIKTNGSTNHIVAEALAAIND